MKKYPLYLLLIVSVSALSALATHRMLAPAIVSFDVKATLNTYHQQLLKKPLSLDEQTDRLSQFATIMNEEVERYSVSNNRIVIVSAAVVTGTADITPDIQRAIIERYQVSP